MTSQRFLNDKVNSNDFLRSLKDALFAPVIMLLVLGLKYCATTVYFMSKLGTKEPELIEALKNGEVISFFGNSNTLLDELPIAIGMMLGGVYMALSLFSFMFKKNSVNVYFSVGVSRSRMYLNRIVASVLEIFAAVFIPLLIVFVLNVSRLGYHSHQLALLGFNTLWMFASGVSGFAIGTFAATVSGSVIETVLTSVSISAIGPLACGAFNSLRDIFLFGYVSDYYKETSLQMFFSPWACIGMNGGNELNELVEGKKLPEGYIISWVSHISPAVIWTAVSIVLLALGFLAFNKRKNENAHSIGKFFASSTICGACVFTVVFNIALQVIDPDPTVVTSVPLCVLLLLVITFVAFIFTELVLRRNIKAVTRTLPVYVGLCAVSAMLMLTVSTDYFGTYNKLPDIKEIECVTMSYEDQYDLLTSSVPTSNVESYFKINAKRDPAISTAPQDIELCVNYFNKIKNDKTKHTENSYVSYKEFIIKTKDGKLISRRFPVYSESLSREYDRALFNSDYFHKILEKVILVGENYEYSAGSSYADMQITYAPSYMDEPAEYYYFGKSLMADEKLFDSENTVEWSDELRTAVYNDLCKITYDEYYSNDYVGALVLFLATSNTIDDEYNIFEGRFLDFQGYEYSYVDGVMTSDDKSEPVIITPYSEIMILPQMTETLKLLEDYEPLTCDKKVKSVIYPEKPMPLYTAIRETLGCNVYYANIFASAYLRQNSIWTKNKQLGKLFDGKQSGTYMDFITTVYNAADATLKTVDDAEKAKQIDEKATVLYDTNGDNGAYIFVVYENGSVVPKYIPEKSVSVLK